jgi:hypothetical protein
MNHRLLASFEDIDGCLHGHATVVQRPANAKCAESRIDTHRQKRVQRRATSCAWKTSLERLTPMQQQALQPLAGTWGTISETQSEMAGGIKNCPTIPDGQTNAWPYE